MLGPASPDVRGQRLARRCAAAQSELSSPRQVRARQHGSVQRRYAVEDRRLVLAQSGEDRRRRRSLRHQHDRGADRQRKRQAVVEAIGEKQLRRGKHQIVLANPEDRSRIQLDRLNQAGVNVKRAFGRARRTRRVKPETRVVAGRFGRREFGIGGSQQRRKRVMGARVAAGDDHVPQIRQLAEQAAQRLEAATPIRSAHRRDCRSACTRSPLSSAGCSPRRGRYRP